MKHEFNLRARMKSAGQAAARALKRAWLMAQYPDRINWPFVNRTFVTMSDRQQIHFAFSTYRDFLKEARKGAFEMKTFDDGVADKGFDQASLRNMRRKLEYETKKAKIMDRASNLKGDATCRLTKKKKP